MGLRETFEKLAVDFARELLALVAAAPVSELAELERGSAADLPGEPSAPPDSQGPPEFESTPRVAALLRHSTTHAAGSSSRAWISVPADKRGLRLDELLRTTFLDRVLAREGYVVLGDLNGRTFADLGPGFQRANVGKLSRSLAPLGVIVRPSRPATVVRPTTRPARASEHDPEAVTPDAVTLPRRGRPPKAAEPAKPRSPAIEVPPFASGHRINELPLSSRIRTLLGRAGFTVLGDLAGKQPSDWKAFGRVAIDELRRVLEALAAQTPSEPRGLLDRLDAALDRLPDDRREVLLLRFGGTGEEPLTLGEIGHRTHSGVTRERVRQIEKHALASLRGLAGPGFGAALRELERRVLARETDLRTELARVGRAASARQPRRPWDHPGFYERLLSALAPGVAHDPDRLDVPAFARGYAFEDLPLTSHGAAPRLAHAGFKTLGDVHDRHDFRGLAGLGPEILNDLLAVIERVRVDGPDLRGSLLDVLDGALDRLDEQGRAVLLLCLGGSGEAPLGYEAMARRCSIKRGLQARRIEKYAVRDLRVLAGPAFGAALRKIDADAAASGTDVGTELRRIWQSPLLARGHRADRPWAGRDFYIRLLERLAPAKPPVGPVKPKIDAAAELITANGITEWNQATVDDLRAQLTAAGTPASPVTIRNAILKLGIPSKRATACPPTA